MCGSNDVGQLGVDPKEFPEIRDLQIQTSLNNKYDVEDIGCGSNHTVLIVRSKSVPRVRKVLAFGHKG